MLARRTLLTGLLQRHAPRLRLSAAFDARAELRAELGRLASELGSAELFFGSLTQPAPSKPQNLASVA
jgi:hypothetical protein